ncbi:MAG TPA: hypothetical protein VK149_00030 [Sideroxyarcus sp.]|nr:hypothetical protein [Sideroxyarcus sp.]
MKPYEKAAVFFLLQNLVSGAAGAVVLGIGILLFDIANLGTLVTSSEHWVMATFLLFVGLMTTFGGVAMCVGVMSIGEEPHGGD